MGPIRARAESMNIPSMLQYREGVVEKCRLCSSTGVGRAERWEERWEESEYKRRGHRTGSWGRVPFGSSLA